MDSTSIDDALNSWSAIIDTVTHHIADAAVNAGPVMIDLAWILIALYVAGWIIWHVGNIALDKERHIAIRIGAPAIVVTGAITYFVSPFLFVPIAAIAVLYALYLAGKRYGTYFALILLTVIVVLVGTWRA